MSSNQAGGDPLVRQDTTAARDAYTAGHGLTVNNYYATAGAGQSPAPTQACTVIQDEDGGVIRGEDVWV